MGLQKPSGSNFTSLQNTVNSLQNIVNTNTTDITNLQNTVNTLQNTVSNNSSNINNLQTTVSNLQTTVNGQTTTINNLQSTVNSLQTSVNSNTTSITNLQNTVSTLQSEVNTNTTDIDNLQSSVDSLQATVNTNTSNISNLQTSVNNLQTSVNSNTTSITNLQNTVNTIQNNVTTNTNNIGTLQSQVNALQNAQYFKTIFMAHPVGGYKSHGFGTGGTATNIAPPSGVSTLDAFPFFVVDPSIVCDKMAVAVYGVASSGTKSDILGIYADNNGYPGTLVATTGLIDVSTVGWKEATFSGGNVTLNSGWYWIARLSGTNTQYNGLNAANVYPIPNFVMSAPDSTYDTTNNTYGLGPHGVRYTYASWPGALPSTFPTIASGAKWLCRTAYASPWVHRYA